MRRIYRTGLAENDPAFKDASLYLVLELITADGTRGIGELSDVEPAWNAPPPDEFKRVLTELLTGADASDRHRLSVKLAEAIPANWHVELRRMLWAAIDIAQKVAEGFRAFKLKVGADVVADCENVSAIRKIAGPEAYIKVDPSGTWNEEQAIENIRKMAEVGVDAVETPVDAASRDIAKNRPEVVNDNPDEAALALARVRRAVPVKIIEHVGDYADVFATALVRHRAVDIFNVIPSQTGSLNRARRLTEIAEAAGLKVLLGSTVEMGVGTAAALHLGVASNAVTAPSDLIGPGHLEADIINPVFTYEAGGQLHVPEGPGLGVILDEAQMEKHRA